MKTDPRIIVALDYSSAEQALAIVEQLTPKLCRLKIGKELFTAAGPDMIHKCHDLGFDIFLDLKFHDIPNTVAKACKVAAELGIWMLNVHASGGKNMMHAALEAVSSVNTETRLIAVTVLTSMDQAEFAASGMSGKIEQRVEFLAELAHQAELDGVVCSAWEVEKVKQLCGSSFLCVTPGVRLAGAGHDDQGRVKTPAQALECGSDYLVIGRPVTQAKNPSQSLREIVNSFA